MQAFGAETVRRWLDPDFAAMDLADKELEELALSMGHHRNILRDEGRGAIEAGFPQRAYGLFLAIEAVNRLLRRIKRARENGGRLRLSQFDLLNLLGTNSYRWILTTMPTGSTGSPTSIRKR